MRITALSREHHRECRRAAFAVLARQPDLSSTELQAEVQDLLGDRTPADWPADRTWDNFVAQWRANQSAPWEFASATAGEAAAVIGAHAAALADPLWHRRWPTRGEAAWIARITAAAPDIPPADAYVLAVRADRDVDSHRAIVDILALAPWRDEGKAIGDAVAEGRLPWDTAEMAGHGQEATVAIQTAAHPKLGRRNLKGGQ
jgi:hypothetical protein